VDHVVDLVRVDLAVAVARDRFLDASMSFASSDS